MEQTTYDVIITVIASRSKIYDKFINPFHI